MNKGFPILSCVLLLAGAALALPFVSAQPTQQPGQSSPYSAGGAPQSSAIPPRPVLSVVVLDPAHGGIDTGARGGGGIRESEVVLNFVLQIRAALERAGFRVVLTRQANDNPSFDERSAIANSQRGAIFVTLHIASTGTPGTARAYSLALAQPAQSTPASASQGASSTPAATILPAAPPGDGSGMLLWDRAQVSFLDLSQRLADIMQVQLSQRFRGSPTLPLTAAVRQLRTVAAPAIAVELSSVTVEDNSEILGMGPSLAEGVAQAVVAFRSYYESSPALPGAGGSR